MGRACKQAAKYSSTSSNLAALCLHVARMIRELRSSLSLLCESNGEESSAGCIDETGSSKQLNGSERSSTKQRISLVSKSRVTCGAINLLRILSHETIVNAYCSRSDAVVEGENKSHYTQTDLEYDSNNALKECFTYRSRGGVDGSDQDAVVEIIASIMALFTSMSNSIQQRNDSELLAIPEVYDVVAQIYSLLLVFLSTQLYQPFPQAIEGRQSINFFLDKWMGYSQSSREQQKSMQEQQGQYQAQNFGRESTDKHRNLPNEPLHFLQVCLHFWVVRPSPPRQSIALHYVGLPKSIAENMTNMHISQDGMYESHNIVMARYPHGESKGAADAASIMSKRLSNSGKGTGANTTHPNTGISLGTDDNFDLSSPGHVVDDVTWDGPSNLLLHPLRSLLILSLSKFFMLPIRLVRMAVQQILLGHISQGSSNASDGDKLILQQLQAHCESRTGWSKTNNILWLTDSPIADLGCALMLILSNNYNCRENEGIFATHNPFRAELASLNDTRCDSENESRQYIDGDSLFPSSLRINEHLSMLSINFESLFEAFGCTVHTVKSTCHCHRHEIVSPYLYCLLISIFSQEIGALWLYTLLLSSPDFKQSISARSDLDTLILPLLRSLYFSTTVAHADSSMTQTRGQLSQSITRTPTAWPFRSQSQLYVILILLLIFSQDPAFGRDSFRRVRVPKSAVKWYKELHKEVSLGSMILLVLLRSISFNLNRLHDEFLLSNTCAVLLNLSPHIVDLNDYYVASRLISVTTSCFKRYVILLAENGGEPEFEGDVSSLLGMHGEVSETILCMIRVLILCE